MKIKRAAAALAAVAACAAVGAQSAAALPVVYNFPTALAASVANPGGTPAGANVACTPSAAHPRPVVLVNGTFSNAIISWNAFAPLLKNNGYCVYTFNYGGPLVLGQVGALGPIAASASELKTEVDSVLASTHASKVDIVGWSQGGMMPRYYLKNLGGAAKVNALIGLSPSNHGTTLDGLATLAGYIPGALSLVGSACPACQDQVVGSSFLTALNAGGDTVPGVKYTVIQTRYDDVVTPYTSAWLSGSNVTNILIQNKCILDLGDHLSMPYDHVVGREVLNALDPAHASSTLCTPVVAAVGG
ncbi:MAG TPA: lipase [Baekduia sp.]|uniref:esterase/lipase family protein n=1 Tax=Baekduia sp. TaxID=2600305 RepID=UPI002D78C848|nr:lipase [Baekduia sp.]HET6506480.1 lipase [Baekduia sp.]